MCLAPVVNGDKLENGRGKIIIMPLQVKELAASPSRAVVLLP
jgi:kynurenine formamidase